MPGRLISLLLLTTALNIKAQQRDLINTPINNADRISLTGDLPATLSGTVDCGPRAGDAPVTGMLLLKRAEQSEAAFDKSLADLTDPASSSYHHWFTATQIGGLYGPSLNDLSSVSSWLKQQGFTITGVAPDRMSIAFSGTVAQADTGFHVAVHNLLKDGQPHYSSSKAPSIPTALAPVIAHVIAFNDLNPRHVPIAVQAPAAIGSTIASLSPADLGTIYNYTPLFNAGVTGKGVTIALLEDADQTSLGDWQIFRKLFGLSRAYPYGTLSETHPQGSYPCADPGQGSNLGVEEAIDVDAATMSAPNATLISAACADTNSLPGYFIALANMLQSSIPPAVGSLSYGEPELEYAANGLGAFKNMLFQEAAALGVSVFNSSGDTGASFDKTSVTSFGIRNGGATSPWVTAVGGTDSGIQALRENPSMYFSPENSQGYVTALSYIPEVPWNSTCASSIRASLNGHPTTGPGSFCNSLGADVTPSLDASGGGPSTCATGTPSIPGVVSGTCQGYPKPAWQSLVGVPTDGVRDVPDVSIFASGGVFGYAFRICDSAYTSCLDPASTWRAGDGTSFAAPLWAGIQALVDQATGSVWGLANPQLYSLARSSYGPSGNAACNSSLGNQISPSCPFHDVTLGDSTIACLGSVDCYNSGGTYGILSVSSSNLEPAYQAQTGYDFTTGIGTPNVTSLVNAWVTSFPSAPGSAHPQ